MKENILGVDIGGTKCAVIFGIKEESDIKIVDKIKIVTSTVSDTLDQIIKGIESILTKNHLTTSDILAIGISCGGPLDSKNGIIKSPPNLPGWDEIPIVQILNDRFGIRTGIQNDANACALAEWKFGAGKGTSNMIFLTFGTGMGAGLILDGKLYSGTNDNAGELGHLRLSDFGPVGYGKSGSFEGFCSGGGIAQLARILIMERLQMGVKVDWCTPEELNNITTQKVAEEAIKGDELALSVFKVSGSYLGKGLSIIVDLLNPEMIVIGSIYKRSQKLLEPYMIEQIKKEALSPALKVCTIKPAALGENIGDYAALSVAANLI